MVSTTTRCRPSAGSAAMSRVAVEAVDARHPDVHEHDVGVQVARQLDRLAAPSAASPTHLDVGLGVEQRAQPGPQQRLVVGEHDPDHGRPAVGKLAHDPEPARAATASSRTSPPSAAARSRMPADAVALAAPRPASPTPRPSSSTRHDEPSPAGASTATSARSAPECRTTLVTASCTTR